MSGVNIIGALLMAAGSGPAGLTSDRIKAGKLPDNIALPALLVRETSSNERQPLKRGAIVRTTDRVSVTVRASSYRDQKAVLKWVRHVCAGQVGNVGGGSAVSILTAGEGPDVLGPADSLEQTQDFRVSFDAGGSAPQGSNGMGSGASIDDLSFAP